MKNSEVSKIWISRQHFFFFISREKREIKKKNRGAQALRALDLSREVRQGPPANHTQAGARASDAGFIFHE